MYVLHSKMARLLFVHFPYRLVMEEDRTALYFSSQNSRIYHGQDLMGIDISENVCYVVYSNTLIKF